jgi:hypothetical protein
MVGVDDNTSVVVVVLIAVDAQIVVSDVYNGSMTMAPIRRLSSGLAVNAAVVTVPLSPRFLMFAHAVRLSPVSTLPRFTSFTPPSSPLLHVAHDGPSSIDPSPIRSKIYLNWIRPSFRSWDLTYQLCSPFLQLRLSISILPSSRFRSSLFTPCPVLFSFYSVSCSTQIICSREVHFNQNPTILCIIVCRLHYCIYKPLHFSSLFSFFISIPLFCNYLRWFVDPHPAPHPYPCLPSSSVIPLPVVDCLITSTRGSSTLGRVQTARARCFDRFRTWARGSSDYGSVQVSSGRGVTSHGFELHPHRKQIPLPQ